MKYICIRESYTDKKTGEEKVSWNRIGVLIEANGKQYVKLYHIPNVLMSVFEPKKKETTEESVEF
ncbi:MAG: hypothetical protein SFH39_00455 [Candidatus Magnetobacterium sp. LHC-1]